MRKILLFVGLLMFIPSFAKAQTCNYNATTSTFAADIAAATAGQTVCLAAGNYGTFNGVTKTSPGVTIYAAPGVTATMYLVFAQQSPVAAWLIFNGITVAGAEFTSPAHNITIENGTITNEFDFWQNSGNSACSGCSPMNNQAILINNMNVTMSGDPNATGGYQSSMNFINAGNTDPNPAGITIENSMFSTKCNDAVDFESGGRGVTIGPGNTFTGIVQGSCENHADAIQFVGSDSPGPTITGNLFYNNSTGIAAYDYSNDATITNNVIYQTTQDAIQVAGFDSATVVEHNTVIGNDINCGVTNEGGPCKAQIFNNIAEGICVGTCGGGGTSGSGAPSVNNYNLCIGGGCSGSNSLNGTPTFVGGNSPTTYNGFALASTSLGYNKANDGTNIGINVAASVSGAPAPPTNVQVAVQ